MKAVFGGAPAALGFMMAFAFPRALAADAVREEPPRPAPRIVCDDPVVDLGRRREGQGTSVPHRFILRNEGEVTLVIREIRSHCACTNIEVEHRHLAPGESTGLSVVFSLQGRKGRIEESLVVHSNDPVRPELPLTFRVRIEPDVTFHPMSFLLGAIGRNEMKTGEATAVFSPDRSGVIRSVESDSPLFEASVDALEPGRRYRIQVQSRPPLESASSFLRATIWVHGEMEGGESRSWRLPVVATRVDDVIAAPEELVLLAGEGGAVRYVRIRSGLEEGALRVLSVEAPASVRATVEDEGPRGYRIRIEADGRIPALDGRMLRIHTDQPGYERIDIPFRVRYERR